MNYNINGLINNALAPKAIQFLSDFDSKFPTMTDYSSQASQAWSEIQRPLKLADDVWLEINPTNVALMPLVGTDDTITSGVRINAAPKVIYGAQPAAAAIPLPEPQSIQGDSGFRVILAADASYDAITGARRAPSGVVGKVYPIDATRSFTVSDARVYGFGQIAILEVDLTGWKKGTVYFQGQPNLDPQSYILSFNNFDYTLETKDVFFKLVDDAFHENLRQQIQHVAQYPLAEKINDARNLLQANLNRQLNPHVSLSGQVDALKPLGIYAGSDQISGYVEADGSTTLSVR
jgi:hypothetical protein